MISSWFESRPLAVLRGTTRGAGEQTVGGLFAAIWNLASSKTAWVLYEFVQPGNMSEWQEAVELSGSSSSSTHLSPSVDSETSQRVFWQDCVRLIRTEGGRDVSGTTFCATGPLRVAARRRLRRQHRRRVATPAAPRRPRAAPQQPTDQARLVFGLRSALQAERRPAGPGADKARLLADLLRRYLPSRVRHRRRPW